MSNVINFLERMGQDAQLRHASPDEVEQALNAAKIDPELQAAILARSQQQLEALLGARTNVVCGLMPGDKDKDDDEPGKDDDDEIRGAQAPLHRAASAS